MAAPAYEPMSIRILADRTGPDPGVDENGERLPWPVAGMRFGDRDARSDPPKRSIVPTSSINEWRSRGLVTVEGSRIVVRSGGPPKNPWMIDADKGIPHMFEHLDAVVFHTDTGDVRYEVVENPDKWPAKKVDSKQEGQDAAGFGGEVRHYYDLQLVGKGDPDLPPPPVAG